MFKESSIFDFSSPLKSKSYSKNAVTKIQKSTILLIIICFLYKYFLLNNIFFDTKK